MKILFVLDHMQPGGIPASLISLLEHLDSRACEVTLMLEKIEGDLLGQIPTSVDVRVIEPRAPVKALRTLQRTLDLVARGRSKGPVSLGRALRKIAAVGSRLAVRLLRSPVGVAGLKRPEQNFDVAVSYRQGGLPPLYVASRVWADSKYMWYHHGRYDGGAASRMFDHWLLRKFDAVVAVSDHTCHVLAEVFPSLESRIVVVENLVSQRRVVERAAEHPEDLPGDTSLSLVTVSRLSREKGLHVSVEAAGLLARYNLDFTWYIIGGGGYLGPLQDLARRLGVSSNMRFLGPKENPYPYMRAADIYVQPSLFEADPITIKEALTLQLPIVASDVPPIRQKLGPDNLGVLVPPKDPELLARAIIRLADRDMRERYVNALKSAGISFAAANSRVDDLFGLEVASES